MSTGHTTTTVERLTEELAAALDDLPDAERGRAAANIRRMLPRVPEILTSMQLAELIGGLVSSDDLETKAWCREIPAVAFGEEVLFSRAAFSAWWKEIRFIGDGEAEAEVGPTVGAPEPPLALVGD